MNEPPQSGRRRSVGDAIGGFARRVGELIGEVAGQLPDGLREGLDRARSLRLAGAADQALGVLRALPDPLPAHPLTRFSVGLCHVHEGLRGAKPLRALAEIILEIGEELGPGAAQLLRAAHAAFEGRHEAALDDLRRAARDSARVIEGDEAEVRFLVHLLAALSHQALGNEDRTLRELQKARAKLPAEAGAYLRQLVLVRGVEHLLAAGLLDDAETWVREALANDADDREAIELLARVLASRGDRQAALAQLQRIDDDPRFDRTRLFVELTVGDATQTDVRALALRVLQSAPDDPQLRRLWALAELRRAAAEPDRVLEDGIRRELIEALARAAEAAPKGARDRQLHELAHAALRLEHFSDSVRQLVLTRLRADEGTASEELRLVRARLRLAARDAQDAAGDFVPGAPPRFRADPDIAGAWGPDPMSPVRDDDTRTSLLAAQRSLAAAELCLLKEDSGAAQDLLVEALVEWPALPRARELLADLVHANTGARLEDLLGAATELLAAVPNRVLGISLEGVQHALAAVIAARERLARPLTIAIMGEFSAGKSTFVNALLGEPVAPMGVLPTTTTINVFRRGPSGGGRVHYRDGHLETLAADEVQKFLHGLDTVEAAKIRHVEIERTGARMGDAAVVDTPGLNALDAFHEQVARGFIDEADAVVWLFSATRSGAASEVGMLASLRAGGRQVLGVLNKVDTLDPAEQKELAEYLREQLGEVLVEVVPVRAREALEHRMGKKSGDDPFAEVERALEQRFLQRARELKRELTQRRLGEAIASARQAVLDAIEALDERAKKPAEDRGRASAPILLARFADLLHAGVLEVDDVLVREGLSLGVLRTGKGVVKGPLDPQDAAYLAACFRDAALAALQRALVEIARDDATASELLDRELVAWAQGHLEGLVSAGFLTRAIAERGAKIVEGEGAAREAFREALVPLATAWSTHARSLVRPLERARARSSRLGRSAPQAEAMRLRATVLASLDALAHAVTEVQT
ncbi:MAG TPA: dynamin family protein [Nannocystaceae bacterium]|nr:dynamin family protein [Nannocystaceae bacterium]